jgi:D-3-phosphoglycerate dehydrogenase
MSLKILLTSTSFQDTPGSHHKLLENTGYTIIKLRGPLEEKVILSVIDQFDAIICGDDEITKAVIEKGVNSRLKVISKYGSGLDKIDLDAAKAFNLPVTNCPSVNQTTVAEHVFALLLSYVKNIIPEHEYVQQASWERLIGKDIGGKTLGVMGTGNVGKEVIKRALAFGMNILAFDKFPNHEFSSQYGITYSASAEEIYQKSDIITLHMYLDDNSRHLINKKAIKTMKKGIIIVNTARAELVNQSDVLEEIESGKIGGYLTDVLEKEPIEDKHPFLNNPKILITPHIGSRTYENVVKQGTMAVKNLINQLSL